MTRILIMLVLTTVVACGGTGGSPTTPTPPPSSPPPATTFTLSGTVSESIPTNATRIAGATVRVVDNANAGRLTTADANGAYTLPNLQGGSFTVDAAASGYVTKGVGVTLSANLTRNIELDPVFQILTETLTGDVSGGSPACGTGIVKPCQIFTLPIHYSGTIEARLTWSNRNNDLDLELWEGTTRLASSNNVATTEEFISSGVSSHRSYQLRVIYYSGSTVQNFQVRVTRPN